MQFDTPVVDRDTVDVTAELNAARRAATLTEVTAPFLTRTVRCTPQPNGDVTARVTLTWRNGTVSDGTATNGDAPHAVFDAYLNATFSVSAKVASVQAVTATTLLLEGGLGAEPATHVTLRCRRNNEHWVAVGAHTDAYEAVWQAVSDVFTWALLN